MARTISDLLDERAAQTPGGLAFEQALWGRRDRVDWTELKRRVDALSLALDALGLGVGDAVAVMGETTGEWAVADLAILGAGGVSVGIYSTLTVQQVASLLADCAARLAVAGSKAELESLRSAAAKAGRDLTLIGWGNAEGVPRVTRISELVARGAELSRHDGRLRELRSRSGSEDVALIIYTSGTTGVPKGAMLSHRNILSLLEHLRPLLPVDVAGNDVTVAFLPMAHVAEHVIGFYGRIGAGYGARCVGSLQSPAVLSALAETRPTLFGSVPRIFEKAYAKIRARVPEASPRRRAIFAWAERTGRACRATSSRAPGLPSH